MTVQELINQALLDIGVLDAGETPSSTESDNALVILNELVTSWSAQAAPIYEITRELVTLTGAQSYTLPTRPVKIKAAAVVATVSVSMPVDVLDAAAFAAIVDKSPNVPFPKGLFYEEGYPTGRIHLAAKPNGGTLELHSEKAAGGGVFAVRETFPLSAGVNAYTIGAGGTFATERPLRVTGASILNSSTISKEARIVSANDWAAYNEKTTAGNFADVLFYDGSFTSPKVYLAPQPASGTLELYSYRALAEFASLATNVSLPPGYPRALRATLALELANSYGVPLTPQLQAAADDARASIFGLNQAVLGHPGAPPIEAKTAAAPPVVIAPEQ